MARTPRKSASGIEARLAGDRRSTDSWNSYSAGVQDMTVATTSGSVLSWPASLNACRKGAFSRPTFAAKWSPILVAALVTEPDPAAQLVNP